MITIILILLIIGIFNLNSFRSLLLIVLFIICSCGSVTRVTTTTTQYKCPEKYQYSLTTHLCHLNIPINSSFKGSNGLILGIKKKKRISVKVNKPKASKMACSEVYNMMNKCMGGER